MHQIKHILPITIAASDDLYKAVRAYFIAHGTSLNAWCIANNVNRQTVEKALKGQRYSKKADNLRNRLIVECLLNHEQ